MKGKIAIIFLLVGSVTLCCGLPALRGYHIGNSLTYDCRPDLMDVVFEDEGYDYEFGWHIACGKSLTYIVDYPKESWCLNTLRLGGLWNKALSSYDWNFITLQAYRTAIGFEEVVATETLINEALSGGRNMNCIFYLYSAWPPSNEYPNYAEAVNMPYTNENDTVVHSNEFADYWYSSVTQSFPQLDIRLIPIAHVLEALDQKLMQIPVGDYSEVFDLYRDDHHLLADPNSGRYVAHVSMLCCILGKNPSGLAIDSEFLSGVDKNFINLVNEVIWSVVTRDERTKISAEPVVEIGTNSTGGIEISFVGELLETSDLAIGGWGVVSGNPYSPWRMIASSNSCAFFKAVFFEH